MHKDSNRKLENLSYMIGNSSISTECSLMISWRTQRQMEDLCSFLMFWGPFLRKGLRIRGRTILEEKVKCLRVGKYL